MGRSKLSRVSNMDSLEKMGEFWDTQDFTDYDSDAPDVDFKVTFAVSIELELFSMVEEQANLRGVKVETLVNLWLQQKVVEGSRVK